MSDLRDVPIDRPRCIEPKAPRIIVRGPSRKWAELLWPCMLWAIFLFVIALGINFLVDIYSDKYDYTKHVLTVVSIPSLVWSAVHIYHIIYRDDYDGRMG